MVTVASTQVAFSGPAIATLIGAADNAEESQKKKTPGISAPVKAVAAAAALGAGAYFWGRK